MRMIHTGLLIVAAVNLAACISTAEDPSTEYPVTSDPGASIGSGNPDTNGLDSYKVLHAPIIVDQIHAPPLLNNPLMDGKLASIVVGSICTDNTSDESFQYIVRCALTANQTVSVQCGAKRKTYQGALGLESEWGSATGSCKTSDCQEWISACVLAHSNFYGHTGVPIQVGGKNSALNKPRDSGYPKDEGAYWGNIFNKGSGMHRYGCKGTKANDTFKLYGTSGPTLDLMGRVCGSYTNDGSCKACDAATSNDPSGQCTKSRDYFDNLDSNHKVRPCAALCATDAGTSSAFYNDCTLDGSTSPSPYKNIITVWRK